MLLLNVVSTSRFKEKVCLTKTNVRVVDPFDSVTQESGGRDAIRLLLSCIVIVSIGLFVVFVAFDMAIQTRKAPRVVKHLRTPLKTATVEYSYSLEIRLAFRKIEFVVLSDCKGKENG